MNPIDQYPGARKVLYLVQWITTGVTGVLGVVFTAQESVPEWYTLTVTVLAFVWTYTGLTAQTNVEQAATTQNFYGPFEPDGPGERGASDLVLLLVFASFVLLVLILTGVLR